MIFVALLTILNAVLHNDSVVNEYRVNIAGLPANIFDFMLVIGCGIGLLRSRRSTTERLHPAILWMMVFFALALIGGLIGGSTNGATTRQVITMLRNFVAAPLALYMAYSLTGSFKAGRLYLYASILAGLGVSVMIVLFFREKATDAVRTEVTNIRAVAYVATYAGLAACLLFYTLASNIRLLPIIPSLACLGVCFVGQFTTLSRSDWLSTVVGLGAAFVMLPKSARASSFARAVVAVPVLIASLYVGLYAGSRLTGKDMFTKMHDRVLSMLPGDHPGVKAKAWDTRLPGTFAELRMWASSPLIGGGFGIQDTAEMDPMVTGGLRHNTWSSTLCETGILGFTAFAIMVGSMIVCGWRMNRDQMDQTTVLIGTMGVICGCFFLVYAFATMSFNQVRQGLPLFVMAGVVLRTRAMQLDAKRQLAEDQAYLDQYAAVEEPFPGEAMPAPMDEPVFGNWYQPN